MTKGYFALVLHAHLPYVRHLESDRYLEERWLHEAITETYVPLLQVFQGLVNDGVDFAVTMTLTPTLVAMLQDPMLQSRYLAYIDNLVALAQKEVQRTVEDEDFQPLAEYYLRHFQDIRQFFLQYDGNLVQAFAQMQDTGHLEIITSAATHAFLPLVSTNEAIRAQIRTGVRVYTEAFHRKPRGIWLPECGYVPGLDSILREEGLEYFFTDTHGLTTALPRPVFGTLSPVLTPSGVAAFARDAECSKQVWSSKEGYPGDYDYREYYRDIGFDLDEDYIRDFIHPDGIRHNTGIKYYRITGANREKAPYNLEWARNKAASHAQHFVQSRVGQIDYWAGRMGRQPIVVAPFDAELFGHWWYEGPQWIDFLFRKMAFDQETVEAITPSRYLHLYEDYQTCHLQPSTWGRDGYADVWLQGNNDWIYPALHACEEDMIELANHFAEREPSALQARALNQAARELMLAQSSDFAFIMDNQTMVDYAVRRTKVHVNRFQRLKSMLTDDVETGMAQLGAGTAPSAEAHVDGAWLEWVEALDALFPSASYLDYAWAPEWRNHAPSDGEAVARGNENKPRVLILSWEFPPMTVGGLSRHVYDLSRFLNRIGWEVHVVTTEIGEYPLYEVVEGVHVHRVHVLKPDGGEFVHWAFQLNLSMIEACHRLVRQVHFDVLHAHDWLVCYAAQELKQRFGLPLVATIHATEYGRNHGLATDLQRYIHHLEWTLTYESQRVILCSTYMREEVQGLFQLPPDKLAVIPNGVDKAIIQMPPEIAADKSKYALPQEKIVLFIGRLVREKGVQVLLEAAPQILAGYPDAKFLIVGKGPAEAELRQRAAQLQLQDKFCFLGFVSDEQRNELLKLADIAVFPSLYEPFGIVALEAMATETPVVVSDVGGLADVVQHGRNGLKAYPGDSVSVATQVLALLHNPDWGRSLAEEGVKDLEKYDWHEIARQTVQIYQQAMGKPAERRWKG